MRRWYALIGIFAPCILIPKASAKRLADDLRMFREWIAIRTATLDVEGDAP